jgi:drug/metabolite transporter (DMT)-like permease
MLVALAALWGASFLFNAIAVPTLGAVGLADARVLIAVAVLVIAGAWRGGLPRLRERPGRWFVLGTVNVAIPFALIAASQLTIPASLAAIVNATTPLWAVLVGAAVLGDRVTATTGAGLATGVLGVALVVGLAPVEGGIDTVLAIAASLLAGLCYALGSHYAKRRFSGEAPGRMAIGQLAAAGIVLAPLLLAVPPREVPDSGEIAAVLALAVASTALAYQLYFRLIEEVGVNSTLTVTYLVPVFGVLWAALFRDEHITGGMVAGTALVLAGVALVTRGTRAASSRPRALASVSLTER